MKVTNFNSEGKEINLKNCTSTRRLVILNFIYSNKSNQKVAFIFDYILHPPVSTLIFY